MHVFSNSLPQGVRQVIFRVAVLTLARPAGIERIPYRGGELFAGRAENWRHRDNHPGWR